MFWIYIIMKRRIKLKREQGMKTKVSLPKCLLLRNTFNCQLTFHAILTRYLRNQTLVAYCSNDWVINFRTDCPISHCHHKHTHFYTGRDRSGKIASLNFRQLRRVDISRDSRSTHHHGVHSVPPNKGQRRPARKSTKMTNSRFRSRSSQI